MDGTVNISTNPRYDVTLSNFSQYDMIVLRALISENKEWRHWAHRHGQETAKKIRSILDISTPGVTPLRRLVADKVDEETSKALKRYPFGSSRF